MITMIYLYIVNHPMVQNINQKILVKIIKFLLLKNKISLGEILRGDRIVNTKFIVTKKKRNSSI